MHCIGFKLFILPTLALAVACGGGGASTTASSSGTFTFTAGSEITTGTILESQAFTWGPGCCYPISGSGRESARVRRDFVMARWEGWARGMEPKG